MHSDTLRRQCRLSLGNEIRQSLPDLGIGEDPLAVLAGEGPTRHSGMVAIIRYQRCSVLHSPSFDLQREAGS